MLGLYTAITSDAIGMDRVEIQIEWQIVWGMKEKGEEKGCEGGANAVPKDNRRDHKTRTKDEDHTHTYGWSDATRSEGYHSRT